MSAPKRIQLKRTKGWRKPANTVVVARSSKWGNPFKVGLFDCGCRSRCQCSRNDFRAATAEEAIIQHRFWLERHTPKRLKEKLAPLRGKDLACWCPLDQPCHADILLEIANE